MDQGAVGTASESVWIRTVAGWHVAFWVVLAIALAATAAEWASADRPSSQTLALAALVGLGLAYALLARPAATTRSPVRSRAYLAILCAAVGLAFAASPQAGFLLFIAYPQVWFFSGRKREGVAWTVALTVVAAGALLVRVGASPASLRDVGLSFGVSLALSILLGLWIASVIDQSQQRADLIAELERTRGELAEAEHAGGVMAERARVAQEIHDTLAQGLTSIVMMSQTARARLGDGSAPVAETLDAIEATGRENLAEARALVAAFAPVPLQDSTLANALERLADRFRTETGLDVALEVDVEDQGSLSRDREVVLLRVAQEALSNVRRHAAASHVLLRLSAGAGEAAVEVADDGAGFAPDQTLAPRRGYGLTGMRHRIEEVGGALDVRSAPGGGTRVSARVPAGGDR